MFIGEIANKFSNKNFKEIFKKCGYLPTGKFDPSLAFKMELKDLGFNSEFSVKIKFFLHGMLPKQM